MRCETLLRQLALATGLTAAAWQPLWAADNGPSLQGPLLGRPSAMAPATIPPAAIPPAAIPPAAYPSTTVNQPARAIQLAPTPQPVPTSQPTPQPQVQGHPLQPVLDQIRASQEHARGIRDYSCVFVKRELHGNKLSEYDSVAMKIRVQPLSVYVYCLGPVEPKGQEVIYVEGRNNNQALAHTTGLRDKLVGTLSLDPKSPRMMERSHYPITHAGIHHLLADLAQTTESEMAYGECDVKFFRGAKVDGRECLCIQVTHPMPRKNFRFHVSRVYYDAQLNLPVRIECYTWPSQPGGQPVLVEEYTYRNLVLNPGLTDADFDPRNPNYKFN